jgi:class 3 adenylate cyclase
MLSSLLLIILIEKQQHKNLLRHMVPPHAIKKLQHKQIVCDKYSMVTVFQSDIVGYTAMSAGMTPIMVMQMLNSFYAGVDELAEKHKLYKIRTIGDAYVCAAGCPNVCSGPDGAERVAGFALDLIEYTANFRTDGGTEISLRAGIHSGQLVAGIVGHIRPQYNIFGDTVSITSGLESSSRKMKIHISDMTWRLLQDAPTYRFDFAEGSTDIGLSGKLMGKTWYIEGATLR